MVKKLLVDKDGRYLACPKCGVEGRMHKMGIRKYIDGRRSQAQQCLECEKYSQYDFIPAQKRG